MPNNALWLKLNLDGIKLLFKIAGYGRKTGDWCDEWCDVEVSIIADNWLHYTQSGELLLACEVRDLLAQFEDLISNKILEPKELEFVEPDFTIKLNPQKDLRNDLAHPYVAEVHEFVDIDAEFKVFFWDDVLTANYLSLCLDREDILAFVTYLKLVTKQINKDDPEAHALMKNGYILEY